MAKKMLIDRVDDLEACIKAGLDGVAEVMELLAAKIPAYDKLVADRKLALARAKKMRMAKRQKRHEMSFKKGTVKNAG